MPALQYRPNALTQLESKDPINFTIIIVYRNEADLLPVLLRSIASIDYPSDQAQWIFVNDDSTDHSQDLLSTFGAKHKHLDILLMDRPMITNSAKKDAITVALSQSLFHHIIVTDADCSLPKTWLQAYSRHYQDYSNALLVAGPIRLVGKGLIASIQQLEMRALQAITVGSFAIRKPFMCNGANLSFKKEGFYLVDGYLGNNHISSGDDIFLLEKMVAENRLQCHYLKDSDAVVSTPVKASWTSMIVQRARWGRKGSQTKSLINKLMGFHVMAMNLLFISLPFLYLFDLVSLKLWIGTLIIKLFTDIVVVIIGNQLDPSNSIKYFPLHFLIYPIITIMIGLKMLGTINWHGRTIDRQL